MKVMFRIDIPYADRKVELKTGWVKRCL